MKLSQLNSNKPKMETIQALNDGADEEDFKQLLENGQMLYSIKIMEYTK